MKELNKKEIKQANKEFKEKLVSQDEKIYKKKDEVQQILLILNSRMDYARHTIHNIVVSLERKKEVTLAKKTLDLLNTDINNIEKELVRIVKELNFEFGE